MSTAPSIGLALIVRDEEESLPVLLESIAGAFDQVVLLDTGSKDRTVEVFLEWANKEFKRKVVDGTPCYRVARFDWIDDFAAARTAADEQLDTDWLCWADADDVITGAGNLRELVANAPLDVAAYVASYNYAQDPFGNCVCTLRRERIVRRGAGTWHGRVHEAQAVEGGMLVELGPDVAEWIHRKDPTEASSSERNMRILKGWLEDEPENPRVLGYIGTELLVAGEPEEAASHFRRYLDLKTGWDEERAQIHRKLGMALIQLGDYEEAIRVAFEAMRLLPTWPDSYMTLAEAHHQLGEFDKSIEWARQVLDRGMPNSLLILNPLDYTFQPRMVLASALGGSGRVDDAIAVAEEALTMVPDHAELRDGYALWLGQRKREATAATFCAAANQLVSHDEQLKALSLLEHAVPHFAVDHPEIVRLRSEIRERVSTLVDPGGYAEHYATGGSKPEDFVADDVVNDLGDALPRCGFLLDGLLEQAGAAA
jgi:tetratricopeptide (TPR) repeat protein